MFERFILMMFESDLSLRSYLKILSIGQSEQSERYTIRRLFLPSVDSYGGAWGCRVPFRLWCSRDFIWCSRDSLDILILYYTSLLFHSVANIYFFPLILFILWCWGLFSRTSYSFSSVHSYLRSILTAGRGGGSLFPFLFALLSTTPFFVSTFHRWTEMTHITLFRFYFMSLPYRHTTPTFLLLK